MTSQVNGLSKKYKTIVIDFPWLLGNFLKDKFPRTINYKMMNDDEVRNFPLLDFADNDCGLFMWVTMGKVPLGLELLQKWGFKYHLIITWHKSNMLNFLGFGRNSELIIFVYRGKFNVNTGEGSYIPTCFKGKNKKHSQKPDEFYEILRARTPEPRIDIFARRRHYGFDAYGDQIEQEIQIPITESFSN